MYSCNGFHTFMCVRWCDNSTCMCVEGVADDGNADSDVAGVAGVFIGDDGNVHSHTVVEEEEGRRRRFVVTQQRHS